MLNSRGQARPHWMDHRIVEGSYFHYVMIHGDEGGFRPTLKPEPTDVPPGPRKTHVMRGRLTRGEELWHPDDYLANGRCD